MRSIFALLKMFFKKLYSFIIGKKPSTDDPVITDPDDIIDDVVVYYGCPNSKKAQKLQLGKTLYK